MKKTKKRQYYIMNFSAGWGWIAFFSLFSEIMRSFPLSLKVWVPVLQSWKKRVLQILQNPTFFRISAKSVLFSAKKFPISITFYKILQNLTKFSQF